MWSRTLLNIFLCSAAFVGVTWMSPLPPMELSSRRNFSSSSLSNETVTNVSSSISGKSSKETLRFFLRPFNISSLLKLKRVKVPSFRSFDSSLIPDINRTEMWLKWMDSFETLVQSHDSYPDYDVVHPTDNFTLAESRSARLWSRLYDGEEERRPESDRGTDMWTSASNDTVENVSNGSASRSFESVLSSSGRVFRWFEAKFPGIDFEESLENIKDHVVNQSKELELDVEQFLDHVFDVIENPSMSNRSRSMFSGTALLLARHLKNVTADHLLEHSSEGPVSTSIELWTEEDAAGLEENRQLDFSAELTAESLLQMFEEWLNATYVRTCSEDSTKRDCDVLLKALENCLKSLDVGDGSLALKRSMDYAYVPVESKTGYPTTYSDVSTYAPPYSATSAVSLYRAMDLDLADSASVEESAEDKVSSKNDLETHDEEDLGSGHQTDVTESVDESRELLNETEQQGRSGDILFLDSATSGNNSPGMAGDNGPVLSSLYVSTPMPSSSLYTTAGYPSKTYTTMSYSAIPATPAYVPSGYGRQFMSETGNDTSLEDGSKCCNGSKTVEYEGDFQNGSVSFVELPQSSLYATTAGHLPTTTRTYTTVSVRAVPASKAYVPFGYGRQLVSESANGTKQETVEHEDTGNETYSSKIQPPSVNTSVGYPSTTTMYDGTTSEVSVPATQAYVPFGYGREFAMKTVNGTSLTDGAECCNGSMAREMLPSSSPYATTVGYAVTTSLSYATVSLVTTVPLGYGKRFVTETANETKLVNMPVEDVENGTYESAEVPSSADTTSVGYSRTTVSVPATPAYEPLGYGRDFVAETPNGSVSNETTIEWKVFDDSELEMELLEDMKIQSVVDLMAFVGNEDMNGTESTTLVYEVLGNDSIWNSSDLHSSMLQSSNKSHARSMGWIFEDGQEMGAFGERKDSLVDSFSQVPNGGGSVELGNKGIPAGSAYHSSNHGFESDAFGQQKDQLSSGSSQILTGPGHGGKKSEASVESPSHYLDHEMRFDDQGGRSDFLEESPRNVDLAPQFELDDREDLLEENEMYMEGFRERSKVVANETGSKSRLAHFLSNLTAADDSTVSDAAIPSWLPDSLVASSTTGLIPSENESSIRVPSGSNESVPEEYDNYYFEIWQSDDNSSVSKFETPLDYSNRLELYDSAGEPVLEGEAAVGFLPETSPQSRLFGEERDFEDNRTASIGDYNGTTTPVGTALPIETASNESTEHLGMAGGRRTERTRNPQDVIPELDVTVDENSTASSLEAESLLSNVSITEVIAEYSTAETPVNVTITQEMQPTVPTINETADEKLILSLATESSNVSRTEEVTTRLSTRYVSYNSTLTPELDTATVSIKLRELSTRGTLETETTMLTTAVSNSSTSTKNMTEFDVKVQEEDNYPPFVDAPDFPSDEENQFIPLGTPSEPFDANNTWLSYLPHGPNWQHQGSDESHAEHHSYYHHKQSVGSPSSQHHYAKDPHQQIMDEVMNDLQSPVEVYEEPLPFRPLNVPTMDVLCRKDEDCNREMGEICLVNGFFSFCDCPLYYQRHPVTAVCVERVEPDHGFLMRAKRAGSFPDPKFEVRCSDELCSNHGNCYETINNSTVCSCYTWYFGQTCQIDAMVMVLSILAGTSALSILALVFCSLCCWRRRSRKGWHPISPY